MNTLVRTTVPYQSHISTDTVDAKYNTASSLQHTKRSAPHLCVTLSYIYMYINVLFYHLHSALYFYLNFYAKPFINQEQIRKRVVENILVLFFWGGGGEGYCKISQNYTI